MALHGAIRDRSKDPIKLKYFAGGMREGEVLKLKWDRVSLEKRLISLRPEDTKERKAKEIPIVDEIYPILQDLHEKAKDHENLGDQKVFRVSQPQFISDVKKATKEIGLTYGRDLKDGFTAHSIRHTFKTNAMRDNIPQAVRMMISGHSTSKMDLHYTHPKLDDLRAGLEKVSQFVKSGEIKDMGASDDLKVILEKLERLSEIVDKTLTKPPLSPQEGGSQKPSNLLN